MVEIFRDINTLIQMPVKKYIFKQLKCLLLMTGYTAFSLAFPGFISVIVDNGIKENDVGVIMLQCTLMLGCGLFMIAFQYFQQVSFYKLAQEIIYNIKHTVFEKLTERNLKFWSKYQVGDIITILESDIDKIETLLTSTISNFVINSLVAVGITIVLVVINPVIGITVLIMSLVFAYFQRIYGQKVQNGMIELRGEIGGLSSIINESVNNMAVIQMADLVSLEKSRFNDKNKSVVTHFISQMRKMTVAQLIGLSFNVFGILWVLAIGAYEVARGSLSVGVLFSMTIYVQRLYGPIVALGNAYMSIKNTKPIIDKVQGLFKNNDEIIKGNAFPVDIRGNIQFKDVCFQYGEKWILKNFNYTVNARKKIGIIGENGSGKSTIIKLLSKVCTQQEGDILLDEYTLNEINYDVLKKYIGVVPQNCFLPSGKLKEIMELNNAKKETLLYELMEKLGIPISKFPEGIESEISENMVNLSGGEIQKLCLIRGFLQNKPIYILDEPTAAMDLVSEKELCKLIQEVLCDKTIIIVTHRQEVLSVCDEVMTLK